VDVWATLPGAAPHIRSDGLWSSVGVPFCPSNGDTFLLNKAQGAAPDGCSAALRSRR